MLGRMELRNTPPAANKPRDGRHCDLCGCSFPAVRCDKCGSQIFCLSCDDMYHRHPKRRFHLRKAVDPQPTAAQARPVLPMKVSHLSSAPGDPSKMPLPPPRKKKPTKSFFDTFRRGSPSSDNSPPLPKKEYSWTDRLGSIKKFMSNRPLPPLPTNGASESPNFSDEAPNKHDLSFIHKRVDEKPPQLPERCSKSQGNPALSERNNKENFSPTGQRDDHSLPGHVNGGVQNDSSGPTYARNRGFSLGDEQQWNARNSDNNTEAQKYRTLSRQPQHGFMPPGGPGYPHDAPSAMHPSASATDLHTMQSDGRPLPGMQPHYPHYPMNPHLPPHYPYPMYPQYPNYPQYFGNSWVNLASHPPTNDPEESDHSETSSRQFSGKRYPFRKRAKRSQSVMVDRMAYPGQFYPFGPFPPGYGPGGWAPHHPMEAPPSPASSIRSLNRAGRSRRRRKTTSEDDDEDEFSVSSSPLSRPKSSSSDRPRDSRKAPPLRSSSSEEESEPEDGYSAQKGSRSSKHKKEKFRRKDSDPRHISSPVPKPNNDVQKSSKKHKKREQSAELSDAPMEQQEVEERASEVAATQDADEEVHSDQDRALSPASNWQCVHCTFLNSAEARICQVCCKTATNAVDSQDLTNSNSTFARSPTPRGRKPSEGSEKSCPSPQTRESQQEEEDISRRDKRDMAILNSALDEAEKEISRGLEELMKLKEDFSNDPPRKNSLTDLPPSSSKAPSRDKEPQPKPVYKSSGKLRSNILDKLTMSNRLPTKSNASTSTSETQTNNANRRPSTSSTTSETFNSPTAGSPEIRRKDTRRMSGNSDSANTRRDSSCQTQQDTLSDYLQRKKAEEEAAFMGRPNHDGYQYPYRMDNMASPVQSMYADRGFGHGAMIRSHSRASLFSGKRNEPSDYGGLGFGFGASPMYRSASRSSLTGDFPESRFSEYHNLRKPDYYLSMEELVERRRQETMRSQGLELVRMIREAEQQGFTADDIQVALTNCGKQNPVDWLQENWRTMVDSVVTLSTNYGKDKKENNDIGVLGDSEARDALRLHKGDIWAAVTECVEGRQRKFLELSARGKFHRKAIVEALTSSQGDVESAYSKLNKSSSKPFLMRIWGTGEGAQNQDGAIPRTLEDFRSEQDLGSFRKYNDNDEDSEEIWDEDDVEEGEAWEEDCCEEDDVGDAYDPQNGGTADKVKTPESERSDYCDEYYSGGEDRSMSSPSDDMFFVIPDIQREDDTKRGTSFLSKLAALRKEGKQQQREAMSTFYDGPERASTSSWKSDHSSVEEGSDQAQAKGYGPFNLLKNTLSAIKDSVTGSSSSKNDKKSLAMPERRTIIVRGKIDHESLATEDSKITKLTSIKAIDPDEPLQRSAASSETNIKSGSQTSSNYSAGVQMNSDIKLNQAKGSAKTAVSEINHTGKTSEHNLSKASLGNETKVPAEAKDRPINSESKSKDDSNSQEKFHEANVAVIEDRNKLLQSEQEIDSKKLKKKGKEVKDSNVTTSAKNETLLLDQSKFSKRVKDTNIGKFNSLSTSPIGKSERVSEEKNEATIINNFNETTINKRTDNQKDNFVGSDSIITGSEDNQGNANNSTNEPRLILHSDKIKDTVPVNSANPEQKSAVSNVFNENETREVQLVDVKKQIGAQEIEFAQNLNRRDVESRDREFIPISSTATSSKQLDQDPFDVKNYTMLDKIKPDGSLSLSTVEKRIKTPETDSELKTQGKLVSGSPCFGNPPFQNSETNIYAVPKAPRKVDDKAPDLLPKKHIPEYMEMSAPETKIKEYSIKPSYIDSKPGIANHSEQVSDLDKVKLSQSSSKNDDLAVIMQNIEYADKDSKEESFSEGVKPEMVQDPEIITSESPSKVIIDSSENKSCEPDVISQNDAHLPAAERQESVQVQEFTSAAVSFSSPSNDTIQREVLTETKVPEATEISNVCNNEEIILISSNVDNNQNVAKGNEPIFIGTSQEADNNSSMSEEVIFTDTTAKTNHKDEKRDEASFIDANEDANINLSTNEEIIPTSTIIKDSDRNAFMGDDNISTNTNENIENIVHPLEDLKNKIGTSNAESSTLFIPPSTACDTNVPISLPLSVSVEIKNIHSEEVKENSSEMLMETLKSSDSTMSSVPTKPENGEAKSSTSTLSDSLTRTEDPKELASPSVASTHPSTHSSITAVESSVKPKTPKKIKKSASIASSHAAKESFSSEHVASKLPENNQSAQSSPSTNEKSAEISSSKMQSALASPSQTQDTSIELSSTKPDISNEPTHASIGTLSSEYSTSQGSLTQSSLDESSSQTQGISMTNSSSSNIQMIQAHPPSPVNSQASLPKSPSPSRVSNILIEKKTDEIQLPERTENSVEITPSLSEASNSLIAEKATELPLPERTDNNVTIIPSPSEASTSLTAERAIELPLPEKTESSAAITPSLPLTPSSSPMVNTTDPLKSVVIPGSPTRMPAVAPLQSEITESNLPRIPTPSSSASSSTTTSAVEPLHPKASENTQPSTSTKVEANEPQQPVSPKNRTPPSPVDAIRNRFESLTEASPSRSMSPIRPQSPFGMMTFKARKEAIAQEKQRESKTTTIPEKKPWFIERVVSEPVVPVYSKKSIKQQLEMERRVRKMVSDKKCRTYRKAEIVIQLMDMNFREDEAIQAANECSTLEKAISFLQQECLLCTGYFPVAQIISMVHCPHKACRECIRAYFTVQIRDRTIMELLCPFCNEPDIGDEDVAQDYFNHLDIMLKKLVDYEIHELFQRKLRDRVLMKDPNFRWCSQCSSGFIAMPNLKRLVCPDCNAVTCASCGRIWVREHQGISCEAFAALKDATESEVTAAGLAKLLEEDGIDCPRCHFRYTLAKGGCMHFRCIQCQHDFCSGCSRPFRMGQKCGVSDFCAKLGLHAHHPRNCLFYLRDKEPEDLQKLLDLNDVEYNEDIPDDMEAKSTCQVMEQKETSDGMVDDYCGKEVQEGYAGLCRVHYVEYLGQLVNKHKVDPIQIFDNDDLELVLKRVNIRLPPKRYRESDEQYREKLVQLIQEELPLDKMEGS